MVFELRNYLLKQGTRDRFIRYFKNHFVDSQKTMGASIPAMFTIDDEPDRFFWVRGFDSMEKRSQFLPAFYSGKVWKEFGTAANDIMLEWHDVHLVKPIHGKNIQFAQAKGVFIIDFFRAPGKGFDTLIHLVSENLVPLYDEGNIMLYASEMRFNDFPRLPVYRYEDLLILITHYKNVEAYQLISDHLTTFHKELMGAIARKTKNKTSMILYPV